jgi:hypothetical protein
LARGKDRWVVSGLPVDVDAVEAILAHEGDEGGKNFCWFAVDPARSEKVVAVGWSGSFMDQPPIEIRTWAITKVSMNLLDFTDRHTQTHLKVGIESLETRHAGIQFDVPVTHRSDGKRVWVDHGKGKVDVRVRFDGDLLWAARPVSVMQSQLVNGPFPW